MDYAESFSNFTPPPLPEGVSLRLWNADGLIIHEDSGKWLHPLFNAEDFLLNESPAAGDILLQDKIAGRAAAVLITRMGFKRCFIEIVSRLAMEVFERYEVECTCGQLVDRIFCRTEDLITGDMDNEAVYRMLRERAGR